MRIYEAPQTLERFKNSAWVFQQTYRTPLQDLPRFVDAIMSALPQVDSATAVFDQVIFEPRYGLEPIYVEHGIPPERYYDSVAIDAANAAEAGKLLEAVLSEWIDFAFIPSPQPFALYADHDEYTTFFANEKNALAVLAGALEAADVRRVEWERTF